MYVCVCVHTSMHAFEACMCMHACVHVFVCVCACLCVFLCVSVCEERLKNAGQSRQAHAEIVELQEVSQFAITIGTA